ncbi:LysR family transcriptional regulator [Oceanimonas sp. CHS3-5]|uniref:LysR family transcriptional regulator n=1 Tax=Oceanimonas sp. CHS3-5 TaxID=3068186 RepID=UPI00273FF3C4|nr:LysR family transcriptional regulator [Oceanimonas sp. CHS3-5]MDP5291555.1 LysR family transcriptional regulator [Oceanimonas sp. CHS3-5]
MDRIDAMRAFVTIVTEGSFTRAAERLGHSPQLVSKSIARLEQQLGTRLLNRTTRRVSPTEAGLRYAERARQILNDIDEMEQGLSDARHHPHGRLRVSAPVSFASRHLAPLLCDYQRTYPQVSVDLQLNDRKVDIVEEGFDVALRIGHLKSSSLIARRMAPIRLVICASPSYLERHGTPASISDLEQHRCLHYSYMEHDTGLPGEAVFSCNNGDVLVGAAIHGAGIVIQPSFIAGPALADGRLVEILPEQAPLPMALYAVYAHRTLMPGKIRSFVDFMDGYFGDPPYWDDPERS